MSELIAKSSGEIRARNALLGYWWYEKSEADKVIAELEDKLKVQTSIADEAWKLKDTYHTSYAEAVKELYEKNKEIRRNKYKRCLAMAKWCHDKWTMSLGWDPADGYTADFFLHYKKWEKRWLELAKKFKEAK